METLNARTEPDCFQGVSSRFSSRPRSKARCSVHQSRRPMMDASPRSDTTVGRASSSTRVSSSALERARRPSVPRGREDASAFVRGARGRRSRAGGRAREGGSPRPSPDLRLSSPSAASVRRRTTTRGFRARRHRPPPPRRVSPAATRSSTVVLAIARAASARRSLSRGAECPRGDDRNIIRRCAVRSTARPIPDYQTRREARTHLDSSRVDPRSARRRHTAGARAGPPDASSSPWRRC